MLSSAPNSPINELPVVAITALRAVLLSDRPNLPPFALVSTKPIAEVLREQFHCSDQ